MNVPVYKGSNPYLLPFFHLEVHVGSLYNALDTSSACGPFSVIPKNEDEWSRKVTALCASVKPSSTFIPREILKISFDLELKLLVKGNVILITYMTSHMIT